MIEPEELDLASSSNYKADKAIDEKVALDLVKETEKELKEYRSQFEKEWREYDNAYYGLQHKTDGKDDNKKTVKNHTFKIIEGEVPILTDSMPGTQVTAHQEDRQADADNLNNAIRYVHQDNDLPMLLPTTVRSSLRSAPGYIYCYFDPDADGGDGKIVEKQLDWENVLLDGNVSLISQSEKAQFKIPSRRGAIARMWPEHKDKIMKMSGSEKSGGKKDNNYESRDAHGGSSESGKPKKHSAKDIVDYKETWIKSYDLEDIDPEETQEEVTKENEQILSGEAPDIGKWEDHEAHEKAHGQVIDQVLTELQLPTWTDFDAASQAISQMIQVAPEAQEQLSAKLTVLKLAFDHIEAHGHMKELNPTGQIPKYKDGWRVIKSVNDTILYDGPNPEQNGLLPIVPFYAYKDEGIYGFGEIKNIIDAQRTLNTVDNAEYRNLKLNGNTGWQVDRGALPDDQDPANLLTDEAGLIVVTEPGLNVSRFPAGQVSPQFERRKVMDQQSMENISGINEESQGNTSQSLSGVAIEKLQTQAVGRIRLKDRGIQYYSIKLLSQIVASLILNHWSEEKQFRLRDENSNIETIIFDPITMQDLKYTVEISPGSMAGISKDAMNSFFLQMFQAQIITAEDFLTVADFPKRQILLKKLQERNAQAAELQAQQQAQQDQIAQAQAQYEGKISELQGQSESLKAENDAIKQVMSPSEKKLHAEMLRQTALAHIQQQQIEEQAQGEQFPQQG